MGRFALVVGEPIDQIDPQPFVWSDWDEVLDGFDTGFYRGLSLGVVAERRYPNRMGSSVNGEHILATLKGVSRERPSEHIFELADLAKTFSVEADRPQKEGATCFWPCVQFVQDRSILTNWLNVLLEVHRKEAQTQPEEPTLKAPSVARRMRWNGTLVQLAYNGFLHYESGLVEKGNDHWKDWASHFVDRDGKEVDPRDLAKIASERDFHGGGKPGRGYQAVRELVAGSVAAK